MKHALKYMLLLMCLAVFTHSQQTPVVIGQQRQEPITKANLISSLKLGKADGMTAERYVELINGAGVAFSLTAEDELRIRRVGRYLGKTGLDNLVTAIRNNYRPVVRPGSTETGNENKPQASSDSERGEPSEAEMKEALERTMQKRGGQKGADGCIRVDNPIAGACVKIEKFEKLGCKPADQGAGYTCTYNATTSMTFHSNERSEAGDKHAEGVNTLLGRLGGKSVNETATKRFVRSREGWIASNE
jgi:hypothetical protein